MIHLHEGSILEVKADALVNPANSFLNHSGGLARIIDECANGSSHNGFIREDWTFPAEYDEYAQRLMEYAKDQREAPLVPYSGVHVSPAGALSRRYKGIIHVVGPIWGGGDLCEDELLELAMENVLNAVVDHGWRSVAVPAISCGVFGFPVKRAATILTNVASWFDHLEITFAVMGDEHVNAFRRYING